MSLAALRQAADGQAESMAERAATLMGRLRTAAAGLAAEGPLQRAYRVTFAAQDTTASFMHAGIVPAADAPEPAAVRAAWDEAAKDWEALRRPYELAIALTFAAETELAGPAGLTGRDRGAAGERLRRAGALAAQLGARPLADTIASLARPPGGPTATSPPTCSSQPRPPVSTCRTSWPSSVPPTGPRRRR